MKVLEFLAAVLVLFNSSCVLAADKIITGQGLPENYTQVKVELDKKGPTLLFSDSPEMVYENGILYRDTVEGDVRVFFHHVNAMSVNKKIGVIVKNDKQLRPINYSFLKKGLGVDSWNYMYAGKTAQAVYFTEDYHEQGSLGFCTSKEILSGRGVLLEPGKLLVGTLDLHFDKPAEISVVMCDLKSDLESFNDNSPILPMDEHPLRGSFANADWYCKVKDTIVHRENNPYMMELASSEQCFAKGVDATTGLEAENYGNYGIVYTIDFEIAGKEDVKMYLNPLGGLFSGYGILENNDGKEIVAIPQEQLAIGDSYDDMLEIAALKPGKYKFIWSPPGASNLPIRLYWI